MKASEAREISIAAADKISPDWLIGLIDKAARDGQTYIVHTDWDGHVLRTDIQNWLDCNGYIVREIPPNVSGRDRCQYRISW